MNQPEGLYSDYSTPATKADLDATHMRVYDASEIPQISLDYAQIIQSLAFLTDEQRAGFFALLGDSYCLHCGSVEGAKCVCQRDE